VFRPFIKALRYLGVLFIILLVIGEIDQFTYGPVVNLQNEQGPLPPRADVLAPGFRMRVPEILDRNRHDLVSLGSAFAINDSGDWATAKHVSRDCAALVVLEAGEQRGYPVKMVIDHPRTDLSVLVTGGSFDSLTIADRDPGTDEIGYFIGYPQGDPASVEANYLGRDAVDVVDDLDPGRPPERLQGDYWVESRRVPNFSGSLGGMSGGPVLDGAGDVIGVTVAEEPRRGRVISVTPERLAELLRGAGSKGWRSANEALGRGTPPVVSDSNIRQYGNDLRNKTRVAEVWCYGFRRGVQPRRPRL
jgi:serine protease Do